MLKLLKKFFIFNKVKINLAGLTIFSILLIGIGFSIGNAIKNGKNDYCHSVLMKMNSGKAIVEIDKSKAIGDKYISLLKEYYTNKGYMFNKEVIIRKNIDDYIVLNEFNNSGLGDSYNFELYMNEAIKDAITKYYFDFIINIRKNDKTLMNDMNFESIYQELKTLFDENNIGKEQAIDIIKIMASDKKNSIIADKSKIIKVVEFLNIRKKYEVNIIEN